MLVAIFLLRTVIHLPNYYLKAAMMIKKNSKKLWILSLCLLSFFMNTTRPYSLLHDKLNSEYKCRVISISGFIGFYSLALGIIYSVLGHNRKLDMPTTPSERHFFVLRNFLPKEDLERIKAHDQIVADREITVGKALVTFGALCIAGGITLAYLNEIFTALTK